VKAEVRIYDRLFLNENPDDVEDGQDFTSNLNPHSLEVLTDSLVEPSLAGAEVGSRFQFERKGYFCVDLDSSPDHIVFNQTVSLRDTWAKIRKAQRTK
jgi:glutaminyl-tRNA synthetase